MPSNFPSEWTFAANAGGGGTPQIVVPAAGATVRHVLTELQVHLWTVAPNPGNNNGGMAAWDGATNLGFLMIWFMDVNPGLWDGSWNGEIVGSPGTAFAVIPNVANPINTGALVTIRGYDL